MPPVIDGSFAETRAQLGGYDLIHAVDLDEAIEVAEHLPGVLWGTVEIRPVVELPTLPDSQASRDARPIPKGSKRNDWKRR